MADHVRQFSTPMQRALAARLAMWVFMASESLLFAALFGLYVSYRAVYPAGFEVGAASTDHVLGAINTGALLTSSLFAALAVESLERDRRRTTLLCLGVVIVLGVVFLVLKGVEYADHFRHGMVWGGRTEFFMEHPTRGLPVFATLYYLMTGLHALHVAAGVCILTFFAIAVALRKVTSVEPHPLELGVLYWHLVDAIWVFLWPMFYFGRAHG